MGLKKTKNHDILIFWLPNDGLYLKCSCGFYKGLKYHISPEKIAKITNHHRKEALDKQFPLNPPKAERSEP